MIKKGSQYRRIFNQEMIRLATTGNIDFLKKRISGIAGQACKSQLKEKTLGYEKLSFLFLILMFGCIMSIIVALLEYKNQNKKRKQELKGKEEEISLMERQFREYLEGLSDRETENIMGRLNQNHIRKERDSNKLNMDSDDFKQ